MRFIQSMLQFGALFCKRTDTDQVTCGSRKTGRCIYPDGRSHLPVVRIMGQEMANDELDLVGPDDLAVGRMGFRYLASKGCKRVAYVTTRPDHEALVLRAMGLRIAASNAKVSNLQAFVCGPSDFGSLTGFRSFAGGDLESLAQAITNSDSRPDGLFVSQAGEA